LAEVGDRHAKLWGSIGIPADPIGEFNGDSPMGSPIKGDMGTKVGTNVRFFVRFSTARKPLVSNGFFTNNGEFGTADGRLNVRFTDRRFCVATVDKMDGL
jgi:hypothetical protein